jgi:hypothetical protein
MAEATANWVAIGSSALAFVSAVFAVIAGRSTVRLTATLQREEADRKATREAEIITSRFRDPLIHASYDLQSRLWNILNNHFLLRYLVNGDQREQDYAVENTVFLVAQFLGWTEAIRQDIQFLNLDETDRTRELRKLQDGIYSQFQRDDIGSGFRLFAGEQRAIGELMVVRDSGTVRCIGFANFMSFRNHAIDQWLDPLRADIKAMSANMGSFSKRLQLLQHSLIDLLEFLDPEYIRFPREYRGKS